MVNFFKYLQSRSRCASPKLKNKNLVKDVSKIFAKKY